VPDAPDRLDDLRLRDRILEGDRDAAEALVRRHLDALYEFVHYRVGGARPRVTGARDRAGSDRATVEDIVQSTLLVALEQLRAFEGRSSLHTWLCGIAKNKIREHRRARRPIPLDDLLDRADPEIDEILAAVAREPLPDSILERRETQALVGATLSSLPPDYREALVGKYVDDLSVAEIGARAGKSEKAAESTLSRARAAFVKVFELLARERGGLG
jgi:RNA polymerase sigma-70 factor (ECF subfamily)